MIRVVLFFCCAGLCLAADLDEIVRRATLNINADWAADTKFACLEKVETSKNGRTSSRTSLVVMLDGSDYRLPVAVDDKPLAPERAQAEILKLRDELDRRRREVPGVRKRRINMWKSKRSEDGELLLDFPGDSVFKMLREETRNGHAAYVLAAEPRPGLAATTRTAMVYEGMHATVWVDEETLQPVFIECDVVKPVPVFGFIASVLPGTRIEIEMSPVSGKIWLIDMVSMKLNVSKLHFMKSTEDTRTTYTDYRPNDTVVNELLGKALALSQK